MKHFLTFAVLIFLLACCTSPNIKDEKAEVSIPVITETPKNPEVDKPSKDVLDFYFTPSVDEKVVHENGQKIIDFLTGETGYNFQLHVTKNYDDMIAAFGTGSADIGIMNSLSYIKAREDFGVTAKLRAIRYGKSTYFGQIVTNASRGIKSLKDLEGKTIAYTDRSSTSGYLFPQRIIKNAGVKPGKIVFAGKHDTVVKMVYEGIADAGATFYSEPTSTGTIRDARARLIDKYPDVEEKVKILTITNPIPNDPVVFAKDLPTEMSYKISLGLIKYLLTEEGKKTMMELYSTDGFMRCSDADYDELRQAVLE